MQLNLKDNAYASLACTAGMYSNMYRTKENLLNLNIVMLE